MEPVMDCNALWGDYKGLSQCRVRNHLAQASRLKLAAKAVELGGSRLLLKEKKFSRVVTRS